jgi:putative endonuclease
VYFEETEDVHAAIEREKTLKGLRREKKTCLIEAMNPRWDDLASEWFGKP